MKKTLSIVLAVLMLVSCIPFFASAATITLSRSNVEIIPPTALKTEINFGETLSTVELTGGTLWYVDPDTSEKTEVAGTFSWTSPTLAPTVTGEYNGALTFRPEDTTTYNASVRLSYLTSKKAIKEGYSWPTILIHGTPTTMVTPPSFTCYAGDSLASYPNYTKTGGKVVDANGTNITSKGQFYINDAGVGGKNQYLYEDTYVTARWSDTSKSGYENAYYDNVLVKVTRKTATLTTAPSIPAVFVGTTYKEALSQLTAKVYLVGGSGSYDTTSTYWVPVYAEGVNADTQINEDTTITVNYQNPATDDTFTAEVTIDVYTKPLAVISENPAIDATGIKPGMKASSLTLTGGKAVKEGTETEVSGTFSIKNPDTVLYSGYNTIDIVFTPDDTANFDGTSTTVSINIDSLITTAPTLDATGLRAGAKASELTLTGGEATEEGTFVIADPEQVLTTGTNRITVKFIPAAEGAEYYETTTVSVIVKGEYKFLDKDGNETVPVYTISYGTRISDQNTNIPKILAQTECCLNVTEKYTYRAAEGKDCIISKDYMGVLLPVGEHIFDVMVAPSGYSIYETAPYDAKTLRFIVKVLPVEMNVKTVYFTELSGQVTVTIDNTGAKGTLDIWIDGVLAGDDVTTMTYGTDTFRTAKVDWTPTEEYNKEYSVKVIYNAVEDDPVSMTDYEGTFRTNLMFDVIHNNRIESIPDEASEGARIECKLPYEFQADFISWYITDLDGNELDVEIYGIEKKYNQNENAWVESKIEAEKTDYIIYFDMPNGPVEVSFKTQAMLDAEAKKEAIDNCNCLCHYTNPVAEFIWKVISFFMDLFGIEKNCACGYPHEVK